MKLWMKITVLMVVFATGAGAYLAAPAGRAVRESVFAWWTGATPVSESEDPCCPPQGAEPHDPAHDHANSHAHAGSPGEHPAHDHDAICDAHGLVACECPFCDSTRIGRLGMCGEHGVPEALCWLCDSKLIAAYRKMNDWCGGHNRPESFCMACNGPRVSDRWMALAASPDVVRDSRIPRLQRAPSPICNSEETIVQLADADVALRAGLSHQVVERGALVRELTCNAEVEYDGNRYAQLSSRVAGVVREVHANLGDRVRTGQPLVVIDSAELATAKADCQQAAAVVGLAEKTLAREQSLLARGISSEREVSEAETRLAEARIALTRAERRMGALGLTTEEIARVTAGVDSGATLAITAPFDGVIVARAAVIGETVDTSRPLFALADTSRMWVMLDIPDSGAPIAIGQRVEFSLERLSTEPLIGELTWISTEIDHKTRNLKARAEFDNARGLLKAHQFGRARVIFGESAANPIVPRSAVQWDGCCNVVFVRAGPQEYQPRKVRLGLVSEDRIEVLEGLREGEIVVAQGSFLLKTEIKKGEIGAGCCPGEVKK